MLSYWQSRWAWTNAVYYGDPRHQGEDPLVFQEHRTPRHADGPAALAISKRPGHPLTRPGHGLVGDPYLTQCRPTRPRHVRPDAGVYRASTTRPQGHDNACQEHRIDSTQSPTPQPPLLNEVPDPSAVHGTNDHQFQKDRPIPEVAQRELGDDTLMHAHLVALEEVDQDRLSLPQVIDLDIRVNEDSHACSRLRGAASAA